MATDWSAPVEAVATTVAVVITAAGALYHFSARLARLELKVETVWEFIMRRALVEATTKGVGTLNSPLVLTEQAREWLEPLRVELQKFYTEKGSKLSDNDLCIAIEKEFGERLTLEICVPHGLVAGSCLLAAVEIAKEAGSI